MQTDWKARSWAFDIESYQRWANFLASIKGSDSIRERIKSQQAERLAAMKERYGAAACRGLE